MNDMGLFDKFLPNQFYHVFSKSNNKEKLFYTNENRHFFLNRSRIYLLPFYEIHAYVLMGDHYHLLLRVRSWEEIVLQIRSVEEGRRTVAMKKVLKKEEIKLVSETRLVCDLLDKLLVHQIQRLSISYTKALNKQRNRKGHLFNRPFKRGMIDFDTQYLYLVYYIHHNARKHGLVKDFLQYKHHSYYEILDGGSVLMEVENVLEAFGGKEHFVKFHTGLHYEDKFEGLVIEEEW